MNPNEPHTPAPHSTPAPAPATPDMVVPPQPTSHVTNAPESVEGHNFDPRIRAQLSQEPNVIHASRAYEPVVSEISDELRQKHERSMRLFPFLNLSEGEFVIIKVTRHIIGVLAPVASTTAVLCLIVAIWIMYPVLLDSDASGSMPAMSTVSLLCLGLGGITGLFGYIAVWVYMRNTFYLTNESVIQEIQYSLFAKHEQTVSLGSIEDVSYVQNGILQTLFNYGSIRLSTEGEETTYRFHYVANPKHQVAVINNSVEAFKNGRPVTGEVRN